MLTTGRYYRLISDGSAYWIRAQFAKKSGLVRFCYNKTCKILKLTGNSLESNVPSCDSNIAMAELIALGMVKIIRIGQSAAKFASNRFISVAGECSSTTKWESAYINQTSLINNRLRYSLLPPEMVIAPLKKAITYETSLNRCFQLVIKGTPLQHLKIVSHRASRMFWHSALHYFL